MKKLLVALVLVPLLLLTAAAAGGVPDLQVKDIAIVRRAATGPGWRVEVDKADFFAAL